MKISCFGVIIFLLLTTVAPAQSRLVHSAYFNPVVGATSINGQSTLLIGAKAVWVMNDRFGIGGAFYGLATDPDAKIRSVDNLPYTLGLNYGGLIFEYYHPVNPDTRLGFSFLMAGGGLQHKAPANDTKSPGYYGSDMLIWQPGVGINWRCTRWLHLTGDVQYRIVTNLREQLHIGRHDLESLVLTVGLRVG